MDKLDQMAADMARLLEIADRIDARLGAGAAAALATGHAVAPTSGGAIASDADLDGKYGDPEIRMNIPAFKWPGEQHKGKKMSAVRDAAFLEAYAAQLEWSADEDVKKGKTYVDKKTGEVKQSDGKLSRMDAARARGWAARVRAGRITAAAPPDDDDCPF